MKPLQKLIPIWSANPGKPGKSVLYFTSYINWKITFKVEGDNTYLKEFREADTSGNFGDNPYTNLQISFDGVWSKAIARMAMIPSVDPQSNESITILYSVSGNKIKERKNKIYSAVRRATVEYASSLASGIYFISIPISKGQHIYLSKAFKDQ